MIFGPDYALVVLAVVLLLMAIPATIVMGLLATVTLIYSLEGMQRMQRLLFRLLRLLNPILRLFGAQIIGGAYRLRVRDRKEVQNG